MAAAMAALQTPSTASFPGECPFPAPSSSSQSSSSSSSSLLAIPRVRIFNSSVRAQAWVSRAPRVAVRAQVEKSSVQERTVEEKDRDFVASQLGFQDQVVEENSEKEREQETEEETEGDYGVDGAVVGGEVNFGEVNKILASRVVEGQTQYLIEWKDEHLESWEPPSNIAGDLVGEFETPWWQAAKKAEDQKLKDLLEYEGRDVNSIDENGRTALFFAAGLGSEKCVKMLLEEGADVHWKDQDGYTALHIAAGYVHTSVVKTLLEFGADPEQEDYKGRSSLLLAQELLERTPRANPMQFARRMSLDQIVKVLDEATYDDVEVERIVDKRITAKGGTQYLVKWSDYSEESWEPAVNISDDLIKDYEEGLEYGIAERIIEKREVDGKPEYLVQWADSAQDTWEPVENIADEIIAEFENQQKVASG